MPTKPMTGITFRKRRNDKADSAYQSMVQKMIHARKKKKKMMEISYSEASKNAKKDLILLVPSEEELEEQRAKQGLREVLKEFVLGSGIVPIDIEEGNLYPWLIMVDTKKKEAVVDVSWYANGGRKSVNDFIRITYSVNSEGKYLINKKFEFIRKQSPESKNAKKMKKKVVLGNFGTLNVPSTHGV